MLLLSKIYIKITILTLFTLVSIPKHQSHLFQIDESLLFDSFVKIGHQSCVHANTMHTELELCTPWVLELYSRREDNLRSEGKIPKEKEM